MIKTFFNEEIIIDALTKFKKNSKDNIMLINKGKSKLRIVLEPTEEDMVVFSQKFEGSVYHFCFV